MLRKITYNVFSIQNMFLLCRMFLVGQEPRLEGMVMESGGLTLHVWLLVSIYGICNIYYSWLVLLVAVLYCILLLVSKTNFYKLHLCIT